MNVYGRERGFLMTVGASAELAERCPDRRLDNWAKMLKDGDDVSTIENRAALICILNKGYELNKSFQEEDYEANPLKMEQVLALPGDVFLSLLSEALQATQPKREIESEPLKKNTEAKGKI